MNVKKPINIQVKKKKKKKKWKENKKKGKKKMFVWALAAKKQGQKGLDKDAKCEGPKGWCLELLDIYIFLFFM